MLIFPDERRRDQGTHQPSLLSFIGCTRHRRIIPIVDGVPKCAMYDGVWLPKHCLDVFGRGIGGVNVHLQYWRWVNDPTIPFPEATCSSSNGLLAHSNG